MSRIDEALRRASQGALAGRSSGRAAEGALRRTEDAYALTDYPQEGHSYPQEAHKEAKSHPQEIHGPKSSVEPLPVIHTEPAPALRREHRPRPFTFDPTKKLVAGPGCGSLAIEQYRRVAATLHEAQQANGLKTVMVTSSVPREGKTLTVTNLALTLSESYGRRVLLIDADLRRPSVHELLGLPNQIGLSQALRSDQTEPAVVYLTPRLSVLPAGRIEGNPLAALSSNRMRQILDEAAQRYDWVLLDTPPVGLLSDTQVLGRLAQAAIFVIRAGATPLAIIEKAIAAVGRDCIIGTVLNGVEEGSVKVNEYYSDYYDTQE